MPLWCLPEAPVRFDVVVSTPPKPKVAETGRRSQRGGCCSEKPPSVDEARKAGLSKRSSPSAACSAADELLPSAGPDDWSEKTLTLPSNEAVANRSGLRG